MDISKPKGQEIIRKLAGKCDILVESRPGYDAVFQGMCSLNAVIGIISALYHRAAADGMLSSPNSAPVQKCLPSASISTARTAIAQAVEHVGTRKLQHDCAVFTKSLVKLVHRVARSEY
ncbi:hypothetical protein K7H22_19605 [Seohaeicola saemankumensis]|nr:hypothetical protein [Seohaeicola saemankumensis]